MEIKHRKTTVVKIGHVVLGSGYPVVIQSMTDTPTADTQKTVAQTIQLIESGSELVRWTVNDDDAARAVPENIKSLRDKGYAAPIIGDFHFNGHTLLTKHSETAKILSKYRINPGNVGKGSRHDENFSSIVKIAVEHNKPVRIGVNWGSFDQELLTELMDKNAKLKTPKSANEVMYDAMIESAVRSAELAQKAGLKKDKIVISVKMSVLQDMTEVYQRLAKKCEYVLHLGLTEAGSDVRGIASSAAALGILL